MLKAKSDELFRRSLLMARDVCVGKAAKAFYPQQFSDCTKTHIRMERSYLWMSAMEFEKDFGLKLLAVPQLKDQVIELANEVGQMERGIVLQNPDEKYRTVTFSNLYETAVETFVHKPESQLRPQQGSDIKLLWDADIAKHRAKSLKGAAPTVEELKTWASSVVHSVPTESMSAPLEAAHAEVDPKQQEEDDADDDVEQTCTDMTLQLPGDLQRSGKGKGKGKIRDRKNGSLLSAANMDAKKRKVEASPPEKASVHDDESARSRSPARSVKSRATSASKRADPEYYAKQASKYLGALDLEQTVAGVSNMGQEMYQARRIKDQLAGDQSGSAQAVLLQARRGLVESARLLAPKEILKLGAEQRQKLIAEVTPLLDELPAEYRQSLILVAAKDIGLPKSAEDVDKLLDVSLVSCESQPEGH